LVSFFDNNKAYDPRPLKGVFVTFQIFEVFENRYDQNIYKDNPVAFSNPAQATTVGSITPWYEDDMKACISGRQLINLGQKSVRLGSGSGFRLTPVMSNLKVLSSNLAIYSLDFGNTWPEQMVPAYSSDNPPTHRGDAEFKTLGLGILSFRYGPDQSQEFYTISVDPESNPREKVFQKGCVFDLVISDPAIISNIQNNLISVYLNYEPKSLLGTECVMSESPYLLVSDQKGCYGESNDLASDGYMVYSEQKEACRIRIFEKGVPVNQKIPIYLAKWMVLEAGNDPIKPATVTGPFMLADGDELDLSGGDQTLDMDDNAIYYFMYDNQYAHRSAAPELPDVPPFASATGYTIMDTGSFICLRVHAFKDYSMYINPANWGTTPPDYDVVYNEVFKLYDIVYPLMAHIHPFSKEIWNNGTMAGLVLQRTNPSIWNNILYMPKSRELSRSQRSLLEAWAQYLKTNPDETKDIIA
jgi:hypothetical protein